MGLDPRDRLGWAAIALLAPVALLALTSIAGGFVSLLTGSILLTSLYNNSRGSILVVAIFHASIDVVVAALEEAAMPAAMETAAQLRSSGSLRVELYPDVAKKMDKVFKHVDYRRARFIAVLGSDEVATGTVTVRNVATKTKELMPRDQAAAFIRRALSN